MQTDANGLYYMRARYYSPEMGRFVNEDPIRDGLNWFAYAGGNPITYFDPTGLIIELANIDYHTRRTDLSSGFSYALLEQLQMLTDYELALDGTRVIIEGTLPDNVLFPAGNELIRRMVESDHIVLIMMAEGRSLNSFNNAQLTSLLSNFVPSHDSYILFDPTWTPATFPTLGKDGVVYDSWRPSYIGLGHELIHADHFARGVVPTGRTINFEFQGRVMHTRPGRMPVFSVHTITQDIRNTDMVTIGLGGVRPGDITENMLREEHGLRPRGAYLPVGTYEW